MSAFGPKWKWLVHRTWPLSGVADMTFCRSSFLWSLLGVKPTCGFALHMSAFDPKRTFEALVRAKLIC